METAYIRHHTNDTNFEFAFRYIDSNVGIDRVFKFQRNINETIETSLARIKANIGKEYNKKPGGAKKKPNKNEKVAENTQVAPYIAAKATEMDICLLNGQHKLEPITWIELFSNANIDCNALMLRVLEKEFKLTYNYPYVGQISLPLIILVGYDCFPSKFDLFFAERDDCLFDWYRGLPTEDNNDSNIAWNRCGQSSFFYEVQDNDFRHKLKLICTPKNCEKTGEKIEVISKSVVEPGPGYCAFKEKQMFTPNRLDSHQFRVISYNLLSDYHCDSDYSRKEFYPYCPPFALTIDYRKLLLLREIRGYHSDICCMQEVDAKLFDWDLKIGLGRDGFDGWLQTKGETAEGSATFYNINKFTLVQKSGINLKDHMAVEPYFAKLYNKIKNNVKLCERMSALSTVLQVTVLKSKTENQYLVVANTHLYFHPDSDHIRLLQIGFFMLHVKHIYYKTISELALDDQNISIIFCGDFNSTPECGIFKLMTEKFIPENYIDFRSNAEEAVSGVTLEQPFNIRSAYNKVKYTHYINRFAGCLDYIFYETKLLRLLQAVPLPSEEELTSLVAIPSIVFPSDHISLVSDFEWIK